MAYITTLAVHQQKIALIQPLDSKSFRHDYFRVEKGFFAPKKWGVH